MHVPYLQHVACMLHCMALIALMVVAAVQLWLRHTRVVLNDGCGQ